VCVFARNIQREVDGVNMSSFSLSYVFARELVLEHVSFK
jgi:hypothetical protein